jgi:hypothetical protein
MLKFLNYLTNSKLQTIVMRNLIDDTDMSSQEFKHLPNFRIHGDITCLDVSKNKNICSSVISSLSKEFNKISKLIL